MTDKKQADLKKAEANQKKQSKETMAFNRYLLLRYMIALFFFLNIYWLVLLIMARKPGFLVPLLLLLASLPVIWEQFKKLHDTSNKLPYSKIYYWLQFGVDTVMLVLCATPAFTAFYPFMSAKGKTLIIAMLALGMMLCMFLERRVKLIEHDRDKYLDTMQKYKDAVGK
ncbi:hypothetical protein LFYK43_16210 [Ligilactobacillus salitolerans]|uniref:Sugar transporter n=1 Tax=Ligilactobacillus salitolerans TaxID=1808352 RepID=A0A401IUF4_9LACO|nr:hypothetical protein [Ligilactobacillus salitolerans]GBG95162.1 hypothetical protein LFYK43_16210 [Ligilactobacillus salitolerans]